MCFRTPPQAYAVTATRKVKHWRGTDKGVGQTDTHTERGEDPRFLREAVTSQGSQRACRAQW